ncbi:hypothetical protein [Hymenobacter koreensis]|uniref:DUF4157 domain-containing protein n=1 Tax=Hymenobacter koreensis TaxID=1084523 RepID=A0ABP8IXB6_9BACT
MELPRIVEHSPLARIARWKLGQPNVAMVLGKSIHLSGVTRGEFLRDPSWVAHEMCHIRQVRQYGLVNFLWQYLLESVRVGYYANRFEVEARQDAQRDAAYYAQVLGVPAPATPGRGTDPDGPGGIQPDVVV